MGFPPTFLLPYSPLPVLTDIQQRTVDYYSIISDNTSELFNKIVSDQIFGVDATCRLKKLLMYKFLHFYLENIQEIRDIYIEVNGTDQTNLYWNELYCIELIKKRLLCWGLTSKDINDIFNLYDLNKGSFSLGVGNETVNGTLTVY